MASPAATPAPASSGSSGGLGGTLKSKLGPWPVWVWLALITAAGLAWWLYEQHKSGGSSTSQPSATPEQAGAPGVVVINQDGPTSSGTEPPPEPGTGGGMPRQPHQVTRAEAQELLARGNEIFVKDKDGSYARITKLSRHKGQLYTGEKGWAWLQAGGKQEPRRLPGGKVGKVPPRKAA